MSPTNEEDALKLPPTILCVDDEPEVLSALERSLRHEPYRVVTARGAQEALKWLEAHPVDLVITDERMPEMTGTELLREVHQRCPKAAMIILTGYPNPALVRHGMTLGVIATLHKPWETDGLRKMIRRIVPPRGEEHLGAGKHPKGEWAKQDPEGSGTSS